MSSPRSTALDDALDLGDGRLQRMVRDRGEPGVAARMSRAEVGEPLVVDAQDLDRRLRVVHAPRGAEDPVEHLGLDTAAVLVLQTQIGGRDTPRPPLAG